MYKLNNLLLKFNVNGGSGTVGNCSESGFGKDNGGGGIGGPRNGGLGTIKDPNLNDLVWNTGSWNSSTNAPHQVLPPTRSTIVPNTLTRSPKHVARWERRYISPVTGRRCNIINISIISCTISYIISPNIYIYILYLRMYGGE